MFKDAKVGDRVWCIMYGWGTVDDINGSCLEVRFDTPYIENKWFDEDGKYSTPDIHPTLFWDEVHINLPKPPKRKLTKTIEGYVNIRKNGGSGGIFFSSEKEAKNSISTCEAIAVAVKVTGEYESWE